MLVPYLGSVQLTHSHSAGGHVTVYCVAYRSSACQERAGALRSDRLTTHPGGVVELGATD